VGNILQGIVYFCGAGVVCVLGIIGWRKLKSWIPKFRHDPITDQLDTALLDLRPDEPAAPENQNIHNQITTIGKELGLFP